MVRVAYYFLSRQVSLRPCAFAVDLTLCMDSNYSFRSELTGLLRAAFSVLKSIAQKATQMAMINVITKTSRVIEILKTNFCNHLSMAYHASGKASADPISTITINSFDRMRTMAWALAPTTLRMPISFFLVSMAMADRPNNPMQEMPIINAENALNRALILFSSRYCKFHRSSINVWVNKLEGSMAFNVFSIF